MAQLGSTVVAGSLTVTDDVNLVKPLSIENGGTGATTAANARINLGAAADSTTCKWTSVYSDTTSSGYFLIAQKIGYYATDNHDVMMQGIVYSDKVGTQCPIDFQIYVRANAGTVGTKNFRSSSQYASTYLKATYEVLTDTSSSPTKYAIVIRLYGVIVGTYHRFNTRIDYTTAGDVSSRASNQGVTYSSTKVDSLSGTEITLTAYAPFKGATSSADGNFGLVPKPVSGDNTKYLKGDGTWADLSVALSTASRVVVTDANKNIIASSDITTTELGYLDGVTSAIQMQLDNKQAKLTNPVTGTGTSGYLAKFNGSTTVTNGPQLGSSTTTFLRNDGTWQVPSVGGDLGSWTPVMTGVSRSGATFTKTSNTSAWDSQVYSKECYNHCMVAFSASQTDGNIMIGLDSNPSQDANYTNIDYAIYVKTNGTFAIYESGFAISVTSNTYTTSDTFSICFFNGNVIYRKGTTVLRTVARSATTPLYLDSSFYTYNKSIKNVSFAAMPDDLSAATSSTLGTIKVGYSNTDKNYKVQLDSSNNAYVNVPWTDTHEPSAFIKSASVANNTLTLTPNTGSATSVTKTSLGLGNVDNTADADKEVKSAGKWTTARNISISDSDGTNTGTAVSVDGSAAKTLKLPATIKAALTGTADYSKTLIGATCSTAVGTAAKTVSISGFTLESGRSIRVLFSNGNSAATPTLNVNSTGAKNIKIYRQGTKYQLTTSTSVTNRVRSAMDAGTILDLYYDGTDWLIVGNPVLKTYEDTTGAYVLSQYYANGLMVRYISSSVGYSFTFSTN